MAADPRARLTDNPFHVLAVTPGATRAEIEEAGQKLLAMLALKMSAAAVYPTPLGHAVRSDELVRASLAELRDPAKRLVHELWGQLPADTVAPADQPAQAAPPVDVLAALGWRHG